MGDDPGSEAEVSDDPRRLQAAAEQVLEHLHRLSAQLEPTERAVLGALLGRGIAELLQRDADVAGYGLVEWRPDLLSEALADAVRRHRRDISLD